ncbi:MAG: helix-turn-helix domain-containing protein [Pseudomonadota bacterium]
MSGRLEDETPEVMMLANELESGGAWRAATSNVPHPPHPETSTLSAKTAHRDVLRTSLEQLVAGAFQLDELLLRMPTRGRAKIARARQAAMYLAHTVCGLSLTEVGAIFERDRTTVAHACAVIEEYREDPPFDRAMDMMERSTRIIQLHAFQPGHAEPAAEPFDRPAESRVFSGRLDSCAQTMTGEEIGA